MRSFFLVLGIIATWATSLRAEEESEATKIRALVRELSSEDPEARGLAARALQQFGPEARSAVTKLIELLADEGKHKAVEGLPAVFGVYDAAFQTLVECGSESVAGLTAALGNRSADVRRRASEALARIGPKAKPALGTLQKLTADKNEEVRRRAIWAILAIDLLSDESVAALLDQLQDTDAGVRETAAYSLKGARNHAGTVIPALVQRLKDPQPQVRAVAALSLGRLTNEPQTVIPALRELLDDPTDYPEVHQGPMSALVLKRYVAQDAAEALALFGDEASGGGPMLVAMMKDRLDAGRQASAIVPEARIVLSLLGPKAKPLVPQLVTLLQRPGLDRDDQRSLLTILRRIGPDAITAVPAIRALFEQKVPQDDPHATVQLSAACALVSIDWKRNPQAWQRLLSVINAIEEPTRDWGDPEIPETLEALGPAAAAAVPGLIKRLTKSRESDDLLLGAGTGRFLITLSTIEPTNPRIADLVIQRGSWYEESRGDTLEAIGRLGDEVVPKLVSALETSQEAGDESKQSGLMDALGDLGERAAVAIPIVLRVSQTESWKVRRAAAEALGRIHTSPDAVLPDLRRLLNDDRVAVREQAAISLAAFKKGAQSAVPALIVALHDDYIDVRTAAAEAVRTIDPEAPEVIRALESLQNDPSPSVREAAGRAVKKVR